MNAPLRDTAAHPGPQVCILVYDGLCTFEFGITYELFGLPRPEFPRWYRFATASVDDGPMRAAGGLSFTATGGLEQLAEADLIVCPGWRGANEPVPAALCAALQAAHAGGARVASICSGVFVLAAAGLLDGRRATTHWRYAEKLAAMYPAITVESDLLYIDNGSVLTSAGSAAGMDLGLHIIRQDFDTEHANTVARRLVVPAQRDGGQRQFVTAPVPKARGGRIAPLLDSIRQRLNEDWPIARMAQVSGLSDRTLARRFREATGETPQGWLTATRVARAAELLESGSVPLDDIAAACGFGSAETFRREFKRLKGVPPSRHRAGFRTEP